LALPALARTGDFDFVAAILAVTLLRATVLAAAFTGAGFMALIFFGAAFEDAVAFTGTATFLEGASIGDALGVPLTADAIGVCSHRSAAFTEDRPHRNFQSPAARSGSLSIRLGENCWKPA